MIWFCFFSFVNFLFFKNFELLEWSEKEMLRPAEWVQMTLEDSYSNLLRLQNRADDDISAITKRQALLHDILKMIGKFFAPSEPVTAEDVQQLSEKLVGLREEESVFRYNLENMLAVERLRDEETQIYKNMDELRNQIAELPAARCRASLLPALQETIVRLKETRDRLKDQVSMRTAAKLAVRCREEVDELEEENRVLLRNMYVFLVTSKQFKLPPNIFCFMLFSNFDFAMFLYLCQKRLENVADRQLKNDLASELLERKLLTQRLLCVRFYF